jgi:hypothetical protein
MAALTGLMVIAGSGMLKDDSVQVSPDLGDATNGFNSAGLSSMVQSAYASGSAEIKASLSLLPSVLSGMPAPGAGGIGTSTNLIDAIKSQADSIVANGAKGFASVFGQSSSHAATSFSFSGALAQAQGRSFDDMGFTFADYDDVLTGGVSSQFNVDTLPTLAAELPSFGTMFTTSDLANMTNPGSVASNLIDQGLGSVGDLEAMLEEEGLDMENLADSNPTVVLDVMSRIIGSDLNEILDSTGFVPPPNASINTLADIFQIDNLLTPEAQSALGDNPTVDDLSRKFSNIGGRFKDIAAMGKLYSSLELKSFPRLKELGALVPSDMEIDLSSTLGKGSGELGNPTLTDMMGSVAGVGYTDKIKELASIQSDLLENSPEVQDLAQYMATNADNLDPDTLDTLIYNINSKPELIETLNKAKAAAIDITERLSTEKSNISVASINTDVSASTQSLVSMAGNLHGYGVDPMSLGMGSVLEGSAKDNVYGDALKASLIEGRNLGRLAVFGIRPGTKMDAMEYANSLKGISF